VAVVKLTSQSSGTAKVWLGFAPLHIIAKRYQPLIGALYALMNRILTISITLYVLGLLSVKFYLSDIDVLNITVEESNILWIFQLATSIGLCSFFLLSVIFSIYKFKSNPSGKNSKRNILISVGFSFFYTVSVGYIAITTSNLPSVLNLIEKNNPELLTDYKIFLESNDKSIQELVESTNLAGQMFYADNGQIIQVISTEGLKVDFIPTEKNIKSRNDMLKAEYLLSFTKHSLKHASVLHACVLLLSLVLGLYSVSLVSAYNKQFNRDK